jgi:cobalt/nickel transport system ATP-binding protein
MGEPLLRIGDLSFAYPGRPPLLRHLSLTMPRGQKIGLMGLNGAGKTTLLHLIAGLLPHQGGTIHLLDRPVTYPQIPRQVGLVMQNPDDQLFTLSVAEDVAFGPRNLGYEPAAVAAQVSKMLHLTGTESLRDLPPHHLSGGEKRMVAIAAVLACDPQLVLYDEPSANLDLRSRRRLIAFLRDLPQSSILSSHDPGFICQTCDRLILLAEGCIRVDGPPEVVWPAAESYLT